VPRLTTISKRIEEGKPATSEAFRAAAEALLALSPGVLPYS
jgi:hypothetical protein